MTGMLLPVLVSLSPTTGGVEIAVEALQPFLPVVCWGGLFKIGSKVVFMYIVGIQVLSFSAAFTLGHPGSWNQGLANTELQLRSG